LALGWIYPNIFSPIHIIFLELIMGPTCSIIYENEPMERNAMVQPPRPFTTTFFSFKELRISIIQGLVITLGTLFVYQLALHNLYTEDATRTMVFVALISANVILTLVNRSFFYSGLTTLGYKNNLVLLVIGITIALTASILLVDPLTRFFQFEHISVSQLLISTAVGLISVAWFEVVKYFNRRNVKVMVQ